ncbi:GreA/GreB family elongation factor [Patescibacteria group bacterium]|nr:GreA/GreB family elongation factor [Patescibacteria group bacterium]
MLEKRRVLQSFIELQEEKIESLRKSIIQASEDILHSKDHNDSYDDPGKIQYNLFLSSLEKSLFEHEEVLVRLKSMKLGNIENISFGSLVNLENIDTGDSKMYFIICVGGDVVDIDYKKITSISLKAPFTKFLINKKENDEFNFLGQNFRILAVQ